MPNLAPVSIRRLIISFLLPVVLAVIYPNNTLGQYNSSFDSAYRSAELVRGVHGRLQRLDALSGQAWESSPNQMISFGKALLNAAIEAGVDTSRYEAHVTLCVGYERVRDYEQAIKHGMEAVHIAQQLKMYARQVRALRFVAFTSSSMGLMSGAPQDQLTALNQINEAMRLVKVHSLKKNEGYTYSMAADIHAMFGKYDTAVSLYHKAIKTFQDQGQVPGIDLYTNLGNTLYYTHDFQGSLAAFQKADSINIMQGNPTFQRLKIASNRAILLEVLNKAGESEHLAQAVLDTARQMGAMDIEVDMVDHLKKLFRKQGRYQEALDFADSLAAIKERMLNAEKTGQVAEMQARYDAGVKDQQIAGQQLTIQQNRQQNLMLWGGIALLGIVGGTAFAGWRRSRQLNRKISTQGQQLQEQKAELQQMNEVKDRLFSVIGHDLRTPVNSLMSYATLLDEVGNLPPEKTKQYSNDLRQTLSYVAALMENLLQFAKTQMQAAKPYPEIIALDDIIRHAARVQQPAMAAKNINLSTDLAADSRAFADEDMTELILRNLISNAVKFSAAGGQITVTVQAHDDQFIYCSVKDQGIGMSPEMVAGWNDDRNTAPIRSTKGTQHEKGAGLGLMLCKQFAGIMGGKLLIESEEGKGSVITLILPRSSQLV